jgi:hypothetical protein
MNTQLITILGLVLNMVGTAILFFFGYPQPNHDEEVSIGVSENTVFTDGTSVKSIMAKARKRKLIYKSMSLIGMGLVFIGFGMQLISVIKAT